MRTPGTGAARVARGLVCGLACLLLGGLGHIATGGQLPGSWLLTVTLVPLTVVGVGLAGAQRGFGSIMMILGGAQLILHVVFDHTAGRAAVHMTAGQVAAGQVAAGQHHHHAPAPPAPVADVAQGALHTAPLAMVVGHLLATAGTAACLAYGERLVWRLAWLLALLVAPLVAHLGALFLLSGWSPAPVPTPRPRLRGPVVLLPGHGVLLLTRGLSRRGPPRPSPA